MDLKKAQEYIKALKNGEKFPKKNMFLIMFLLGALLFVIVLPTGSSAPTSEKGGLDENKRKENKNENIIAIAQTGMGKTEAVLHALCPDSVNWKSGKMLNGYDRAQMEAWVRTLA